MAFYTTSESDNTHRSRVEDRRLKGRVGPDMPVAEDSNTSAVPVADSESGAEVAQKAV